MSLFSKEFNGLAKSVHFFLVGNLLQCVSVYFLALFEEAWMSSNVEVEEICNTFNGKFEKLDKLHGDSYRNIWTTVQQKTITSYLTSMMRRKISASSHVERIQIAEKIRREAEIFCEFFSAMAKEDMGLTFDPVLSLIANIITTDEEMLTFELMTFLRQDLPIIVFPFLFSILIPLN